MAYPMPDKLIREFAKKVDNLIVLEELDPIVEDYVKSLGDVYKRQKEVFS